MSAIRHPDFIVIATSGTWGSGSRKSYRNSLAAGFEIAAEQEADLNWETRELLESICSSVSNVVSDFDLDVQDFGGMIVDN